MTTKHSLITYHTGNLESLIESRGDRLLELTGSEKLQLIAAIAGWQAEDTESVEAGGDSRFLAEFVEDSSIEFTEDVLECLGHVENCEIDDFLGLIVAIAHQLKEGAYLQ